MPPDLDAVRWLDAQDAPEATGRLTAIESRRHLPFDIARVFYVHQVADGAERGGHAHRDTDQAAVAVHGSLRIDVSDGERTRAFTLDSPARMLFLPRMVWVRLYAFSPDAVCLVLASTLYDRSKSIRAWPDYLTALRQRTVD